MKLITATAVIEVGCLKASNKNSETILLLKSAKPALALKEENEDDDDDEKHSFLFTLKIIIIVNIILYSREGAQ